MAEPAKKSSGKATSSRSVEPKSLARVLDKGLFAMHFQPIVDLRSRAIFAYESLCRPQDDYFKSPVALIEAAVKADRIGELGRLQRTKAVKGCGDHSLFVNLEPHEFDEPWLVRPDDPIFMHRHPVYLEITENVPLKYFEQCHSVLGELRKKGTLLVIDDFGAGFSNFKYIADLEPDVVKLDRELVRECTLGTSEFHLLKSITELCHQMKARVVAEGIETVAELEAVLGAGIDYGQGYLLARPSAEPPEIELLPGDWPPLAPETEPSLVSDAGDEAAAAAAERELALRSEIEKLSELLIESEAGRLTLAKRLRERSPVAAPPRTSDDVARTRAASPSATSEPPPERKPIETPTSSSSARRPTTVTFAKKPRFETDRDTVFRYVGYAAVPVLLAVVGIGWALWPSDNGEISVPGTSRLEASVGEPTGTAGPMPASGEERTPEPAASGADLDSPIVMPMAREPGAPSETGASDSSSEAASRMVSGTSSDTVDAAAVANRISTWADAWSAQRAADYVASYSPDFVPPSGQSFREWVALRRERIEAPAWIDVEISDLEISFAQPNFAVARFVQSYSSPGYSDQVVKVLEWTRETGGWRILTERSE